MAAPRCGLCVAGAVEVARGFKPMTDADKEKLLTMAKPDAGDGRMELFKSTQTFDGPHHRRQHEFAVGD